MNICNKCGTELLDDTIKCPKCGCIQNKDENIIYGILSIVCAISSIIFGIIAIYNNPLSFIAILLSLIGLMIGDNGLKKYKNYNGSRHKVHRILCIIGICINSIIIVITAAIFYLIDLIK